MIRFLKLSKAASVSNEVLALDPASRRKNDKPKKGDPPFRLENMTLPVMEFQFQHFQTTLISDALDIKCHSQ